MGIKDSLEVLNPIKSHKAKFLTLGQLREVNRVTGEIVDNLSDAALAQMLSGNQNDVEKLFEILREESFNTLYGKLGLIKDANLFYLEKLQDSVEETFRIENLNYFILSTLPDFELNWHHLEWGQEVMKWDKVGILAARGHGKSFYFSNATPCWKMYRYRAARDFIGKPRKELVNCSKGFLLTNENELAKDFLEIVKTSIEESAILREKLFPENKDFWGKEAIRCKNGAQLKIKSYGGSFRGRHPGYIIVDDYLKDNVIYSELQRRKATNYFHSVIMNAIVPEGQVIVVGTPFHEKDLYGDLKQKKGWKIFEYPAIFPDGRILWKNRFPLKLLLEKREEQGNLIFSRELLCRPISESSTIFPFNILKRSFIGMGEAKLVKNRGSYFRKFNKVVIGCDFALSASVAADYSFFTTWGIDGDDMYLMHVYREKGRSYAEQIGILKTLNSNFSPDVIVAEANVFQMIFTQEGQNAGLPIFPHTTGKAKNDLKEGWPGLSLDFERGKIHLPRGDQYSCDQTDLMLSEFSSIAFTDKGLESVGTHDDACSSTYLSKIGAKKINYGVGLTFLEDI
jgi:hypothetical protein